MSGEVAFSDVVVVSGFVPLRVKHPIYKRYHEFWARLVQACAPYTATAFRHDLAECDYYVFRNLPPAYPAPSDRYETDADFVASNVVQHQRLTWARRASELFPDAKTIVWLDYGIMKQGMDGELAITAEIIREFLDKVAAYPFDHSMPFPGINPNREPIKPFGHNWRFCGSTHIWPVKWLPVLQNAYQRTLCAYIGQYGCLPLDLAIWPDVEKLCLAEGSVPFQFYPGEYDRRQLTGFPEVEEERKPKKARVMLGVPCFAGPGDLLRRAIGSFLEPEVRVVAIDNGATPEVKAVLEGFGGSVEVLRNPTNIYVNPAWNQLAKHFLASDAEVLVIANSDLVAIRGWSESLLNRHTSSSREFWVGRQIAEAVVEAQTSQARDLGSERTDAVNGAFFAMTREAVSTAFPIPSELLLHCGDDWVHWFLVLSGYSQQTLSGMAFWHAGFASGAQLPEFHEITARDRNLWETQLCQKCTGLATIEKEYFRCKTEVSDIYEHIPILSEYSSRCERVTEMGAGRSTWGLLHGRPKWMRSYDVRLLDMESQRKAAAPAGIDFAFVVGSSLEAEIEETDLLFIDTIHDYTQLGLELGRHSPRVRKYILMHDTETYGSRNETTGIGLGLWPAVSDFLMLHSEWLLEQRLSNNNGLTILARS